MLKMREERNICFSCLDFCFCFEALGVSLVNLEGTTVHHSTDPPPVRADSQSVLVGSAVAKGCIVLDWPLQSDICRLASLIP